MARCSAHKTAARAGARRRCRQACSTSTHWLAGKRRYFFFFFLVSGLGLTLFAFGLLSAVADFSPLAEGPLGLGVSLFRAGSALVGALAGDPVFWSLKYGSTAPVSLIVIGLP